MFRGVAATFLEAATKLKMKLMCHSFGYISQPVIVVYAVPPTIHQAIIILKFYEGAYFGENERQG